MSRMLVLCLAAASLAACARSHGPESDSETHFLELCESHCPGDMRCLCGVCTRPCTDDSECSELDSDARCDAPVTTDGLQCAPTDRSPGICQLEPLTPDAERCGGTWPGAFVASGGPHEFGGDSHPLEALAGYERVEGELSIGGVDATDLRLLSCLKSVHGLNIESNSELATLEGLEGLTITKPQLYIIRNPKLRDISALHGIWEQVQRDPPPLLGGIDDDGSQTAALLIEENDSLRDLAGLEGVEQLAGLASINHNVSLESIAALRGLESVGGSLEVLDSPRLENLSGLDDLTLVAIHLAISGCDAVRDLEPLSNLREVGGVLTVSGNASLRGGAEPSLQSLGLTSLQHLAEQHWGQSRAVGWSAWENASLGWSCCDGCGAWGCPPLVPSESADAQ